MKQRITNFINRVLDVVTYKDRIRLLEKKIKELEKERQPLIDLKNKYLTEIRVKNMEIGRLNKKVDELKETILNLYDKIGYMKNERFNREKK